jgi:hypothetical protein
MPVIIRVKRGTETQVRSAVLQIGEMALATDTNKLFIQGSSDLVLVGSICFDFLTFTPRPAGITEYQVPYAVGATTATTLALTSGRTYWIPFVVFCEVLVIQLAVNVIAKSTGTHYIGIYASNYYWQPTGSPLASISFDVSTNGVKTGSVSIILQPNVYWFAWAAGSAATVWAIALEDCPSLGLGNLGTAHTTCYYTIGSTLPDPAPSLRYIALTGSAVPAIGVQFSYA